MDDLLTTVLAATLLGFGAFSRLAERSVVTPTIVFTFLGLGLGPWGVGWIELSMSDPILNRVGELALILVLFSDASRIDLVSLRSGAHLPARLLGLGLPLTFATGTLLALVLFPSFGPWEALVLAAILAPTDAALGQAVVISPLVPERIRQALNVESGLNDGIALPVVLIAISIAGMMGTASGGEAGAYWARFAILQIGLAPFVGIAVGFGGGRIVAATAEKGWTSSSFERLSALALAVLAYALAESIGGNGFIAAFICGFTIGNTAPEISRYVQEFAEAEGQLLTLLVFLLFGAVIVPEVVHDFDLRHAVYAFGSLTLVRMVPVALSLIGSCEGALTVGFIGWFGPRGLASILYMLIVVEEGHFVAGDEIASVVALTVLASTILHGATAFPIAALYGSMFRKRDLDVSAGTPSAEN